MSNMHNPAHPGENLGVDHGGRASVPLAMPSACDLWLAERTAKAVLKKIKPLERVPA